MKYHWYKKGRELLWEIEQTDIPESMVSIWYIGQMGVVIKWKSHIIYIDPVLNDLCRPDGATRRNYEIPFLPEEASHAACVICSHNHADHMNLNTLLPMHKANSDMKIIVPEAEKQELISGGIPPGCLIGANEGDSVFLEDEIIISPVAAAHEEYHKDKNGCYRCLGYVIELGNIRLYHAGDTMVTPRLMEDVARMGPFQAAFLPINGTDEERRAKGIIGNMGCRDAVYLSRMIDSDMTVPLHYDMVMGNEEDPLVFAAYMQEYAPGRKYHIMALGERMIY